MGAGPAALRGATCALNGPWRLFVHLCARFALVLVYSAAHPRPAKLWLCPTNLPRRLKAPRGGLGARVEHKNEDEGYFYLIILLTTK